MKEDRRFATIGFIGFGLIGGSIGRGLKKKHPTLTMLGYQHCKKLNPDYELGLKEGVLDKLTNSLEDFSQCNIIFLCAPVMDNIKYLPLLKEIIKEDCIITDVGSVKGNIHKAIIKEGLSKNFIGGHPMAGSEKSGFQYTSPKLFENAYYILTPTDTIPLWMVDLLTNFVKDLGAIPITLKHEEHDKIVAAISHLPHIIAASLVNLVENNDQSNHLMKRLAAGGFRDITRIASSSPTMWGDILIANEGHIQQLLKLYIDSLEEILEFLVNKDGKKIYHTFASARDYRNALPEKGRGVLEKMYEIYMDIEDETGAIAKIARLLAKNDISIKNIGIVHNREFQDGVLRIEFYEEETLENAITLLKGQKHTIYER